MQASDCCRVCLRIDNSLTSTNTTDIDNIRLCDKLTCCVSEIVSKQKTVEVEFKICICCFFFRDGLKKSIL